MNIGHPEWRMGTLRSGRVIDGAFNVINKEKTLPPNLYIYTPNKTHNKWVILLGNR